MLAAALLLCSCTLARADAITITDGGAGLIFDGELTSFTLIGPGTVLTSDARDYFSNIAFGGGETVTFTGSLNPVNVGVFHGFDNTVNGVMYSQVLLKGSADFTTDPYTAPDTGSSPDMTLSIPFTLAGHFEGYAFVDNQGIPAGATALFVADVVGRGLFDIWVRDIGDNTWFNTGGGASLRFGAVPASSPTPEPGTMILLATGIAGALRGVSRRSAPRRAR
jgi:hypothetical protein